MKYQKAKRFVNEYNRQKRLSDEAYKELLNGIPEELIQKRQDTFLWLKAAQSDLSRINKEADELQSLIDKIKADLALKNQEARGQEDMVEAIRKDLANFEERLDDIEEGLEPKRESVRKIQGWLHAYKDVYKVALDRINQRQQKTQPEAPESVTEGSPDEPNPADKTVGIKTKRQEMSRPRGFLPYRKGGR